MPRITRITHVPQQHSYSVFIDDVPCMVRERTFPAMGLNVDDEITLEQLQYLDNYHWKISYAHAWEQEKHRLDRAEDMIHWADTRLSVIRVGFGASTTQFIPEHPEESGAPDLAVVINDDYVTDPDDRTVVALIEVSGTETMRGADYWVRPDKLDYARNHPEHDIWIVLHYAQPNEHIVCIKPDLARDYVAEPKVIRGSTEYYVVFTDNDPEVVTIHDFSAWLQAKVDASLQPPA